jgi:hypothetical protein
MTSTPNGDADSGHELAAVRDGLTPGELDAPSASLRVQILATEHWSLLATRSTTWSEIMSRITIQLTVLSASLVVLALVAQASGFGTPFKVLSIGLAAAVLVLGTLTSVRVRYGSMEDHALIVGMNRLRAAYLTIDPSLSPYFVTGAHDDRAGVMQTYTLGVERGVLGHVVGSTAFFLNVVNTIVAGVLGALVVSAAGATTVLVVVVGVAAAAAYFGAMLEMGRRGFTSTHLPERFPTPG